MSPARRSTLAVATALTLGGCLAPLPPARFDATSPRLSPTAFFAGRTTSWGVLETRGGAPARLFEVEGEGRPEADGSLTLDQTIRWAGGKVERRRWRMRTAPDGHFSVSLTDASGPVRVETHGAMLHLRYPLKAIPGGAMEQWLYLQSDGRIVLNEGAVRVLGVTVARLSERITHVVL